MSDHADLAKHYGNMRFAMFTVFTAILGAFTLTMLSPEYVKLLLDNNTRCFVSWAGVALSILFILAEFRVSMLVQFYQSASFSDGIAEPGHNNFWKVVIPIVMMSPYIVALIFWTFVLAGRFDLAAVVEIEAHVDSG